jgi:hypothetical protein
MYVNTFFPETSGPDENKFIRNNPLHCPSQDWFNLAQWFLRK